VNYRDTNAKGWDITPENALQGYIRRDTPVTHQARGTLRNDLDARVHPTVSPHAERNGEIRKKLGIREMPKRCKRRQLFSPQGPSKRCHKALGFHDVGAEYPHYHSGNRGSVKAPNFGLRL
jgi:hypothetical protein